MEDSFKTQWWKEDADKNQSIFATVKAIRDDHSDQLNKQILFARMYSNSEITGLSPLDYRTTNVVGFQDEGRVKLNVVSSVCNTINSKMAKSKPRITLLPNNSDFSTHKRVSSLEKFISGVFDYVDVYDEAAMAFMDSLLFGTGVVKVFEDNGNIAVERVLTHEIVVDAVEGFYGRPRSLHQIKEISRDVLEGMFPGKEATISSASAISLDNRSHIRTEITDTVTVIESWHLPSGPKDKGLHVISVDSGVLSEEDYQKDDFPFVFLQWSKPIVGFFGIGVVADIVGVQVEINKLLIKIQKTFHRMANPTVFVNSASAISKAHLSNEIGAIVPYTGEPPIVSTPQTVHPEVFGHLWQLYGKAFEIAGVSQLAATSKKPEGLDSGTALREFNDIESERFALAGQNYEALFIDVARKVVTLASEIYADNKGYSVQVKGKGFIETIKWKDVHLEEDQFSITVAAASSLPTSKAGRTQIATEWFQAGLIDAEQWRELLDIPDLENTSELNRAPRDYIRQVVDNILTDGEYMEPEPMDDLGFAYKHAVMSYQKAKLNSVEEEKLDMLLDFISDVENLQDQAIQQEQAKQMEAQMAMQPPVQPGAQSIAPQPGVTPQVPTNPIG